MGTNGHGDNDFRAQYGKARFEQRTGKKASEAGAAEMWADALSHLFDAAQQVIKRFGSRGR